MPLTPNHGKWISRTSRIVLVFVIVLFLAVTAYFSFNNYFRGNVHGFVICPSVAISDSKFAATVVLRKVSDDTPLSDVVISSQLSDSSGKVLEKKSSETDLTGSSLLEIPVPDGISGPITFSCHARTSAGSFSFKKKIPVKEDWKIGFITDKDNYSPGDAVVFQTELSKNALPAAGDISLRMFDPSGNILFSTQGKASDLGVFSGTIPLGSRILPGLYKIDISSSKTAISRSLRVSAHSTDSLNLKINTFRGYFLPGRENYITLTVQDRFGAKVAGAEVFAAVSEKVDDNIDSRDQFQGETDLYGRFTFKYRPGMYEENVLSDKKAEILIEASAKNLGKDQVMAVKSYPFTEKQLGLYFFPEAKVLVPGLQNRIFLFVCTPDGAPAESEITVNLKEQKLYLETDKTGLTSFVMDPALQAGFVPMVKAKDSFGNKIETSFDFSSFIVPQTFVASAEKSIYNAGDFIDLKLRTTESASIFYLYLLSGNRILFSKMFAASEGTKMERFVLPFSAKGPCNMIVAKIDADGVFDRISIPVYIVEKKDANLSINTDKQTYFPYERAKIDFKLSGNVSDSSIITTSVTPNSIPFFIYDKDDLFIKTVPNPIALSMLSSLHSPLDPSADIAQNNMRVLTSVLYTGESREKLYFEDVYTSGIKSGYEKKITYYKDLLSLIVRVSLLLCLLTFSMLIVLVLFRFYALLSSNVHPLSIASPDELGSLLTLNIGIPFVIFLSSLTCFYFLFAKNISFDTFLSSNSVVWPVMIAVILLFLFALTLTHIISTFKAAKVSTSFIWSVRCTLVYTISLIIVLLFFMLSLRSNFDLLTLKTILTGNIFFIELAVVSFFLMPFIILSLSFAYFTRPMPLPFYRGILYFFGFLFVFLFSFVLFELFTGNTLVSIGLTDKLKIGSQHKEKRGGNENNYEANGSGELVRGMEYFGNSFLFDTRTASKDGNAELTFSAPPHPGEIFIQSMAYTKSGKTPSISKKITVVRPYSVLFTLPSEIYEGDKLVVPVYISNNTRSRAKFFLRCVISDEIAMDGAGDVKIELLPGASTVKRFYLKAVKPGAASVSVSVQDGKFEDTQNHGVNILPNGYSDLKILNGVFGDSGGKISLSDKELAGVKNAVLYIEPGFLTMLLEANRNLKHHFSSTSYYSIYSMKLKAMILKYMADSNNSSLPVYKEIEGELIMEYQNLLVYKSDDDMFSVFENSKPSIGVTANTLDALSCVSSLIFVDPDLQFRVADKLLELQRPDGSWETSLIVSSRVLFALESSGYSKDKKFKKGLEYLKKAVRETQDPYALALAARVFYGKDKEILEKITSLLNKNLLHTAGTSHWSSSQGLFNSVPGLETDIETTALALRVLNQHPGYDESARLATEFLMKNRDKYGDWYSLSAAYESLETLMAVYSKKPQTQIALKASVNKKSYDFSVLTDLHSVYSVDIDKSCLLKDNTFKLNTPAGIYGTYRFAVSSVSDKAPPVKSANLDGLKLKSSFSRKKCSIGDSVTQYVTLVNESENELNNLAIEIPYPPGFSFVKSGEDRDEFFDYVYDAKKVIVYLKPLAKDGSVKISFRFRAMQEGSVKVSESSAYIFFNPLNRIYSGRESFSISR